MLGDRKGFDEESTPSRLFRAAVSLATGSTINPLQVTHLPNLSLAKGCNWQILADGEYLQLKCSRNK